MALMPPSLSYDALMERMNGHPYANYFVTWCPFDSHQKPALLVFNDGLAKCLSCDKVWSHAQVAKQIGSRLYSPPSNTRSLVLPSWKKWEREYEDLEGITNAAHRMLTRNRNYQTYLKRRKIYEFTEDGILGYLDGWITFPILDNQSKIIDIVVRSIQRDADIRYVVHPSSSDVMRPIYVPAWERVNKSETVYIVYGIIDAISLHLAGLPVLTGITGKSLSHEILKPLHKKFIVLPDAGEEEEAHRLANKLGWRCKVKKIDYYRFEDEKIKDPDSIRRAYGNDALLQALA
jgi:hypothetical protein